jgi:carboxylesterase type B
LFGFRSLSFFLSLIHSARALYGIPVWRYRFRGLFPSYRAFPWLRSSHTEDVMLLWGMVPGGRAPRPVERAAMSFMQHAWAAFARDPVSGLHEFGWPAYTYPSNGKRSKFYVLLFRYSPASYITFNFSPHYGVPPYPAFTLAMAA